MKLECEGCGTLPYVEIDGSCVNKQYQGTFFQFYPNRSVRVRPEDAASFTGQRRRWFKTVQEYVIEGGDAVCPKCQKAAYVEP